MAQLLPRFIVILVLLSADGATERLFCEGQKGDFIFPVPKGAEALDVKNSTAGTMLHWSNNTDHNCSVVEIYQRRLNTSCNSTHIVFTFTEMTQNDTGDIKVVSSGENKIFHHVAIIVAGTVFLNRSCSVRERTLVCEHIDHLQNRTVQILDADGLLRHWFRDSAAISFPGTEQGTFRVVLDSQPEICYHPFTFTLYASKSSQPSQCTASGELSVPSWCIWFAATFALIAVLLLILLVIVLCMKCCKKGGNIGPPPDPPKQRPVDFQGPPTASDLPNPDKRAEAMKGGQLSDGYPMQTFQDGTPPSQAFRTGSPQSDEISGMTNVPGGPQTWSKTKLLHSYNKQPCAPTPRLRFQTVQPQPGQQTQQTLH